MTCTLPSPVFGTVEGQVNTPRHRSAAQF